MNAFVNLICSFVPLSLAMFWGFEAFDFSFV
jgi:hypothetical protein